MKDTLQSALMVIQSASKAFSHHVQTVTKQKPAYPWEGWRALERVVSLSAGNGNQLNQQKQL